MQETHKFHVLKFSNFSAIINDQKWPARYKGYNRPELGLCNDWTFLLFLIKQQFYYARV